ncbi:MAG: cation:proton antiporter [Nanoarchaeota archaeon]|nr:cation:proton antiporter [Nanoarchaeota archaeon]MBU1644190.1 cation:proton antiporter [Nanoarchaeota archaeon]MBU1976512.1 cation:proton antiporter [Nanoarchaeota archaeon]
MDVITLTLLAISLIIVFGFFAELLFRKLSIPDVLFLIILGFVLGPNVLNYVSAESLGRIAPVFTTFTLMFLIFDGAFNIHLSTLIREFSNSLVLTSYNFVLSSLLITLIFYVAGIWMGGFSFLTSLLVGFLLGGVSSSFSIPILRQLKISPRLYSLLTLESALTDVFCIVFSLTIIKLIQLGSFGVQATAVQIISQFAIGGLIGIVAGIIWAFLVLKVFKEHNYMVAIAYLIFVYVLAEFLKGSGAIAALFFGLVLKNSKQLSSILVGLKSTRAIEKRKALRGDLGVSITTPSEQYFYHQISFFVKTFFFVYIGVLINLSDWKALLLGGLISFTIMGSRMTSLLLTRKMEPGGEDLINAVFARGLAAAAIAQTAVLAGLNHAAFISKVTYVVITGTIILSSIKVFIVKRKIPVKKEGKPVKKEGKK